MPSRILTITSRSKTASSPSGPSPRVTAAAMSFSSWSCPTRALDRPAHFSPPLPDTHEFRIPSTQRLGGPVDFLVRHRQVERIGMRLTDVPGCVEIDLDVVSLGIVEVHRPGIAVTQATQPAETFPLGMPVDGAQIIQRFRLERDLVDRAEGRLRRPPGGKQHLVVFGRVPAEEDIVTRCRRATAAVALDEAEHFSIEASHPVEVADEDADVREVCLDDG